MTQDLPEDDHKFDPAIQTEDIAYRSDEMVACPKCSRQNPPNRLKCLYCAAALEVAPTAGIKPKLRKLEGWEKGWNVILTGSASVDLGSAASYLSTDADHLSKVIGAGTPLPIVRVEDEREANILAETLAASGLRCSIVSDDNLNAERPPVRIAAIDVAARRILLTDFNTRETVEFDLDDLALIVVGEIETSKVDSLEKRRRGKEIKVLSETATTSDETVVDLYIRLDPTGYRIHMAGFDFSCLGGAKTLLATENIRLVVEMLKEIAPNARVIVDYARISRLLDEAWPIEARKEPQGLRRAGFARQEFGAVATTSNLSQFTKYSRMQWHLL